MSESKTPLFPTSAYPPLQLARPLSAFGKQFRVEVSTPATLSPDTVLRAVGDSSLQSFIRDSTIETPDGARFEGAAFLTNLRQIRDAAKSIHRPSSVTKKTILRRMKPVAELVGDDLEIALNGQEPPTREHGSDWETVLHGMRYAPGTHIARLIRVIAGAFAMHDAELIAVREVANTQGLKAAIPSARKLLSPRIKAWSTISGTVPSSSITALDTAIETLVRLEIYWHTELEKPAPDAPILTTYLKAGRRPMGHWLVELMTALRAKNLKQLHEELLRAHVLYGDTPISHDLLKKWASSKSVVMPPNAMWPTVSAIPAPDMKDRLATRFFVARALTFLCDFLRSASLTEEAPEWDTIQAQIARRYLELWNSIRAST